MFKAGEGYGTCTEKMGGVGIGNGDSSEGISRIKWKGTNYSSRVNEHLS